LGIFELGPLFLAKAATLGELRSFDPLTRCARSGQARTNTDYGAAGKLCFERVKKTAVAGGGRNEETNSKYAGGIRIKQYPN